MTAGELHDAVQRLHGRSLHRLALVELFVAIFPVSIQQLSDILGDFERIGTLEHGRVAVSMCLRGCGDEGGQSPSEECLANVLHYFCSHTPGVVSRPLSFYMAGCIPRGTSGSGGTDVITCLRALRCSLLRLCEGIGGACNGFALGLAVGTLGGLALLRPPSCDPDSRPQQAASQAAVCVEIVGRIADTISPLHVFGSVIFAVALVIVVGCMSVLVARIIIALLRLVGVLWRWMHHALWVWAAACLGRCCDAQDADIGMWLWLCCALVSAIIGATLGFARAMAVADPSRRRCRSYPFCVAAMRSFRSGARVFIPGPVALRRWRRWLLRRPSVPNAEEELGDGSLRCS